MTGEDVDAEVEVEDRKSGQGQGWQASTPQDQNLATSRSRSEVCLVPHNGFSSMPDFLDLWRMYMNYVRGEV